MPDFELNIQNYDMDLYVLSSRFFYKYKIEHYSSFIWTERCYSAGEFQVVMPPTPLWMNILVPGCLVAMRGRREVMMVENQSFDNGLMTVTGSSLLKFFNQRISWFKNPDYDPPDEPDLFSDYERDDLRPGEFIADVINKLCIHPPSFNPPYDNIALDWKHDKFSHLSLGYVTRKGYKKPLSFPNGQPIYDALTELATREHVGIEMYLERANMLTGNYVLRFRTFFGKDRTSSQTDRETIRFSPKLESLIDPKELRSNSEYKNVCYVNYKGRISVHYAPHVRTPPLGFNRRVTYVDASDKKMKASKVRAYRRRVANKEFRQHIHTHQVDGQVIANLSDYQYGFDYNLGDIVEVEGHSGMIIKARVSEYVRSQDQYGPKIYPTLEVMAEDETSYHSDPTFEPDLLDPAYPETPSLASNINLERAPAVEALDEEDDLSFNPYTDPVFEGDDDPFPDPQEDVGDLLDPGTETVPVVSQGKSSLDPWEVSDWDYHYNEPLATGFYVHQGNVYVLGMVSAYGSGPSGSDVLLSGIPSQYAPDAPASGKVLIDHVDSSLEYAFDSGLKIGPWLDVTINPDGTVTLDDGNPFRPDDFTLLSIHLSTLTWPMSSQIYDAYDTDHSLDDWINTGGWENSDGTYSSHDERLHLNGKIVKTSTDDANPLIHIPFELSPSVDSQVITMDGYRFAIAEASYGHTDALYEVAAQDPQSAENNGCGFLASYFFDSRPDGYLTRGSSPTLSFTPATADAGVDYTGCSGSPINDLPDVADWIGNTYSGSARCRLEDLISLPIPFGDDPDYSVIHGANQLSFVCGLAPGIASYYKVVFTYDSDRNKVSASLLLEQCGGTARGGLGRNEWTPFVEPDGTVVVGFGLEIKARPLLISPEEWLHPGYNNWIFTAHTQRIGSDYDQTPLPVGSGSPVPSGNAKGDMGFHLPSGVTPLSMSINGLGMFPRFAEGDTIDFTNCGWPIAVNLEEV